VLPDVALRTGQDETPSEQPDGPEGNSDWQVLRLVNGSPSGNPDAAPDGLLPVEASDILERTHDGVWVVDAASLRVIYANHGLVHRLGYRRDDVVGTGADMIAPGFTGGVLQPLLARLRVDPTGSLLHRIELRGADGHRVPVEVRTQALPAAEGAEPGAQPPAYVCVARDLGDRPEEEAARRGAEVAVELFDERARIGRDLHDGVIQRIFATGMAVRALRSKRGAAGVDSDLARIADELDHCIVDLRSAVDGIDPPRDVETGLRADLMEIVAHERAALLLTPHIQFSGRLDRVGGELHHQTLVIFREVLSNIARHAEASRVDVVVAVTDDSFLLSVSDDGVGFDPDRPRDGRGLRNLAQRARLLGGSFTVRSSVGKGTVVECFVPLAGPAS
jgi:PAS domain S-box-containing protein